MLNLDGHIKITPETIRSPNLCERFSKDDLQKIGIAVANGYSLDKLSRTRWEERTQNAMDLAMQIQKEKNFPWANCSNIAFPLITIAVLQFHARAYPALMTGTSLVKCRVLGEDPTGEKRGRARRVARYMSYQVTEEDEAWEEQHDRLLINYSVVGSAFIKTYHSSSKGHDVSDLVLAKDLVLNYWSKSVNDCSRKTHVFPLSRNDIHERILRGTFRDILDEQWYAPVAHPTTTISQLRSDARQGIAIPQYDPTTTFVILEQHCNLDLDGDGYDEPYIVTIEETSKQVLRIITRFESEKAVTRVEEGPRKGQIISIKPTEYFTKYGFIPSPDGGIYDIGFGVLCGPLNESANSLVNQLVDAGTMANGGGGFLGRGAKIRGGNYSFAPFEWKRIDSTGEDLHKSIVPLQIREPSNVLLSLLSLIIDYTNRITGSTDVRSGENPGQNTPASTTQAMIKEGGMIYSAIFKRAWRGLKEEFKKRYALNTIYMPSKVFYGDQNDVVLHEDFNDDARSVVPAADPNVVSDEQALMKAQALKQAAMTTPGYQLAEVEHRYLQALQIEGIDQVYPGADKVKPLPNFKMQIEQMKYEFKKSELETNKMMFVAELQEQQKLNAAEIIKLHAQAAKFMEEAGGVQRGHEIAAFEAMIGARKMRNEAMAKQIELLMKGSENESAGNKQGGLPGMAPQSSDQGPVPNAQGMAGEAP